jgi:hypothetical protein
MSAQPQWELVAQLGDANPIDHGGHFVYVDLTGVYPPESELLIPDEGDEDAERWTIYRYSLDKCTLTDGILSDNPYHPSHPAWFATPDHHERDRPQDTTYLGRVADCCDIERSELERMLCGDDPVERATAYHAIGSYHGWENLDSYPRVVTSRDEIEQRYAQ